MKLPVTLITCLFLTFSVFAQKADRFYKEKRFIETETPHVLRMEFSGNDPHKVDDEFWGSMTMVLSNVEAAVKKGTLNLLYDEKLITCEYDYNSAWTWHGGGKILDGTVQILKWGKKDVTVKINFTTANTGSGMYTRFNGTHTYKYK